MFKRFAPTDQPGSRAIGSIAAAIRGASKIGPFGMSELAMLTAFVATWLLLPLALPRDAGLLIQIGVPSLVGAVLATEAYVRAMPSRSRRAFEAFSWLGEWELARARATIGGLPTSPGDAEAWLAAHPETKITNLDELPIRIEILLLAGRPEEARAAIARLPVITEWDLFERAALADLVDWRSGGDGDLAAMEAAADELQPPDSDDRLRADVMVAVAKVRRRIADRRAADGRAADGRGAAEGRAATADALEPLLDVRPRLGHRADGQVGRALRRRLFPVLLVVSLGFGFIGVLLRSVA